MALYLGLDSSTQSLTAVVIEITGSTRRVVHQDSLVFDADLPHYGTTNGVTPSDDERVRTAPPLMWVDALDHMMAHLAAIDLDWSQLAAVSGSAQQHGSVYLNARAADALQHLDPQVDLVDQVRGLLSRAESPIWMDSSTTPQCEEITAAVGGGAVLVQHTGSRAHERFTGPQIRKFWQQRPDSYGETDRIHLVSSFMASLLTGGHAPLEPGDASGMNLMDLASRSWWKPALDATVPALLEKLPPIVAPWTDVGPLAWYWQKRYGLPPARVIAWSGDNPCSLIGTGLVSSNTVAISLGTSDTVFAHTADPRADPIGAGHVFGAPTGAYMGLVCFRNGSLARERVRRTFGLDWEGYSALLSKSLPGNLGRILLPWFEPEITPPVPHAGVVSFGVPANDAAANVRGVIEAQMLAARLHSAWMAPRVETIYATGGAAINRAILQVTADVFGADVYQFDVGNSAALGAALRAYHGDLVAGGEDAVWSEIVRGFADPLGGSRIASDPARRAIYREMLDVYAACEAFARDTGADPTPQLTAFRLRLGGGPAGG
jgi:xylulokinase